MCVCGDRYGIVTASDSSLPELKPEDEQHFSKLLQDVDETTLEPAELRERKIMTLLLKIKNGTPPMRKAALRYACSSFCYGRSGL